MPVFDGVDCPALEWCPSPDGKAIRIGDDPVITCPCILRQEDDRRLAEDIAAEFHRVADEIPPAMFRLSNALIALAAADNGNASDCVDATVAAMENLERCYDAVYEAKELFDLRNGAVLDAIDMRYDALILMLTSDRMRLERKLNAYYATKGSAEGLTKERASPLEVTAAIIDQPPIVPPYTTRLLTIVDTLRPKIAADPIPTRWTRESIVTESRAMIPDLSDRDAGAIATILLPDSKRGK